MTDELKPCPFCGGKITRRRGLKNLIFFCCYRCGSITSFNSDWCNKHPDEALKVWNRRAE